MLCLLTVHCIITAQFRAGTNGEPNVLLGDNGQMLRRQKTAADNIIKEHAQGSEHGGKRSCTAVTLAVPMMLKVFTCPRDAWHLCSAFHLGS